LLFALEVISVAEGKATLLLSCIDRPGIIARVATHLFTLGCNIITSDQYTDEEDGDFFCVVTNHRDLEPLARPFEVPFTVIPVANDRKSESEAALLKHLAEVRADTVVLARYMQVLSGEFLRAWNKPIINIHHSFLPAFAGPRPHKQAHDRGVKLIGATAHYVTEELDAGPIIAQATAPMTHRDTVADLARKGK